MGLFSHSPWASVSVWPCWAVPVIVGTALLTGAATITIAVALDVAGLLVPASLPAVSCTLIVWPTSPGTGT